MTSTSIHDRLSALGAELDAVREGWGELGETDIDGGVAYTHGDPVVVHVRKRGHRYRVDDRGGAVQRAGRPRGWLEAARQVVEIERSLNLSRAGTVFVPAVQGGADLATLVLRVADASAAVYQELLDLE